MAKSGTKDNMAIQREITMILQRLNATLKKNVIPKKPDEVLPENSTSKVN